MVKLTYFKEEFQFSLSSPKACTAPERTMGKEFSSGKLFKGVFATNVYYVVLFELQEQDSLTRKDVILFSTVPRKKTPTRNPKPNEIKKITKK